jgi:DNA-binding transcriptional LysR family regulator
LFHRSGKGLVLTDRGELLLRKAQPVVAQMNNLRSLLTDEHMNDRGELKVACGCSFLSYAIPDVVREFGQTLPRVRLSVCAADRVRSLQMLRDREVDLAILTDPPIEGTEFTYTRLFEDELLIAVPVGSSMAALERIPLRMLGGKTLLLGRNKSHTVRILQGQMRTRQARSGLGPPP